MTKQWVYRFSEGKKEQKMLLGGKGANLAEMTNLGLPIPPGFTITTESCIHYFDEGRTLWAALKQQIDSALIDLENAVGKSFHNPANPLLVSVRSGAAFSMPGMMDTILNLGLNDASVAGLAEQTQNPTFAFDSYRRFIQMFADVVKSVPRIHFTDNREILGIVSRKDLLKSALGDSDLNAIPVGMVMTKMPNLYTVFSDTLVVDATKLLVTHRVDSLPVLSRSVYEETGKKEVIGKFSKSTASRLLLDIFNKDL